MGDLVSQKRGVFPIMLMPILAGLTLFFLLMTLLFRPVPLSLSISPDLEGLDASIADVLLRTEAPGILLTEEQVEEIMILYNEGLEFDNNDPNDPNDPCRMLKLTSQKKLNKWINQFKQRGFTVSKIMETLKTGTRSVYNHRSGSNFTRIIHPDGSCIIVDFVDCIIWQIAPADFKF